MTVKPGGIGIFVGQFLFSSGAYAQQAAREASLPDHAIELEARFSFWHGLQLHRADGSPVELGYFGWGYEAVFQGSDRALDSMRTFRKLRISGTVFRGTGLAAMATQLGLVAGGKLEFGQGASLGLLIGSAVLALTGSVLMQAADSYLSVAVQHYNRDLHQPRQAAHGPRTAGFEPSFSFRGAF